MAIIDNFFLFACFGCFALRHINLHGLLNAKSISVEGQQWYYLNNYWERFKGILTIPKYICQEVNDKTEVRTCLQQFSVSYPLRLGISS